MATAWATMTYILLPPATVLLVLMTVPFPGMAINNGIVRLGDFVFNLRIGTLRIFAMITLISFAVLCAQTYDLQKRYAMNEEQKVEGHFGADLQKKATRWRVERNWWISALTFTIYWMLLRFHSMKKDFLKAKYHEE